MRCSAKATFDPSGLINGHSCSCGALLSGDSLPLFMSRTHAPKCPPRLDWNDSLDPSADSDGDTSMPGSRVNRCGSPAMRPSFVTAGTLQISTFGACVAKTTLPSADATGCTSLPLPFVTRTGLPETVSASGRIAARQMFEPATPGIEKK